MENKKFTEPILIKAGSKSLSLGLKHTPPMCDVRILSEVNYQKLKKAYDKLGYLNKIIKGLSIKECPFITCSLNTGSGGCFSTNVIQCNKIPDQFNDDK